MLENQKIRPVAIIGPDGERLTLNGLPPPGAKRWVSRRKAQVVAAVDSGLLTAEEACERYEMTIEELTLWRHRYLQNGMCGLRVTRTQYYRAVEATKTTFD